MKSRNYLITKAEYEYQHPTGLGRPRRKLVKVKNRSGLICIECNKAKPLSQFALSCPKDRYFESMCRTCKNTYRRNRRKKTKQ